MKTKSVVSQILKIVGLISMTMMLVNCAKDKGNSTQTVTPTVPTYQMVGNLCYQNVNGVLQQVANTALCTQGAGTYQMINNICYQLVNGQYVPQANTALCANSQNGVYQSQVCSGPHTDGQQWVNCGTQMNCAGYTLYNQTGQIVRCQ